MLRLRLSHQLFKAATYFAFVSGRAQRQSLDGKAGLSRREAHEDKHPVELGESPKEPGADLKRRELADQ